MALLIPEGFAHGFQALVRTTRTDLLHSQRLSSGRARAAFIPQEPRLASTGRWPIAELSARDRAHPMLSPCFSGNFRVNCRHCSAELSLELPRSRQFAAVECLFDAGRSCSRRKNIFRCGSWSAKHAGWCRPMDFARPTSCSRANTPISQLLDHLAGTCRTLRCRDGRTFRAERQQPCRGGRLQRRIPAAICQGARNSLLPASSRRRAPRAPRAKRASIPSKRFSAPNSAARLAAEGKQADLMAANNVLAHVPDINDFLKGFAHLLKPAGRCDLRVSASVAAARRKPVRHHLSRALFLPVADSG